MKKLLLLYILVFSGFQVSAQFVLTPDGVKYEKDIDSEYIVIECGDQTQDKLFKLVQAFVNKTYNSPNFVFSNVDNEMITISAESEIGLGKALGMYDAIVNYKYKISIYFKNGRIRIDVPNISFPYEANNGYRSRKIYLKGKTGMMSVSIFDLSGKLKQGEAKCKIETDINEITNGIILSVKRPKQQDEW